jgi:hypothetical protein
MPTHRLTIEVELPETHASAVRALGEHPVDDALRGLASVALREWLEWLVADDRPASLTEVSKRRVKALVDGGLLPKIPTAQVIAQRARLTLGQARYIVSALALEDPAASAEARNGLMRRLREALASAGISDPEKLDQAGIDALATGAQNVILDVPRHEAELASATHEELLTERFSDLDRLDIDEFEPPRRRRRTDSYVSLELRPHVAVIVLQRLGRAVSS